MTLQLAKEGKKELKNGENLTYLCVRVAHDLTVYTVTHPKLLSKYNKPAVLTCSKKDRTAARSDHDVTILTVVDQNLTCVILNIQITIRAQIDGKPISVDSASITEGKLVLHFLKAQEFSQFFPFLRCDFSACYRSFEFIQFFR